MRLNETTLSLTLLVLGIVILLFLGACSAPESSGMKQVFSAEIPVEGIFRYTSD